MSQADADERVGVYLDDCLFDYDITRDMRPADIARSLRNLLDAGLPIANQVHVLNQWRF